MLFAVDYSDKKVHIDNTHSNLQYYCPYCGVPLIIKKGEVRQHHFAHSANHRCTDLWERTGEYDMSEWHVEWQSRFPEVNQEIKLALGETKHRADVIVNHTVIEFQHSLLSPQSFDDRNNFYRNLEYKVTWMFDLRDIVEAGRITYQDNGSDLEFSWTNPKKAFNRYDYNSGYIELFFQITEEDIVQVREVSDRGFESFKSSSKMSKTEFLEHVGLKDGVCLPPYFDESTSERYLAFKKKYNINLNKQQERALLAVEGSNQLIAVPGSGKTTVLVDRLGYMVIVKGIDPSKILAITFTKKAALEMKERFCKKYGDYFGNKINFRTLNSLANEIYRNFCNSTFKKIRELRNDLKKSYCTEAYMSVCDESPSEEDVQELMAAISYIKNMNCLDDELQVPKEVAEEIKDEYPKFVEMYKEYKKQFEKESQMDYDDQMVYAFWILNNNPDILKDWHNKYEYICVDEAQDTSKIQHDIIRMLSVGNNVFMVGDEDQSIYGFRGAYPRAFLNFRFDYTNPYILRMETNYRSTKQIVGKAQAFISANRGRYEKNMVSERGEGENVHLIRVNTIEEQYCKILDIVKRATDEIAILYRDNESAVVLVDLFLRNEIKFKLKKPEQNVFKSRVFKDIKDYLTLAVSSDPNLVADAFERVCYKGVTNIKYLPKKQRDYAIKNVRDKGISIFDAIDEQMQYLQYKSRDMADNFRNVMTVIAKQTSYEAIETLMANGYGKYMEEKGLSKSKIIILKVLAKQEPNISKFLDRLNELESDMDKDFGDDNCLVTLSTIHTSKGLEYDNVYIIDVYDGRFPSSKINYFSRAKDNADGDMEERRLFYVGMTRAKNNLTLFDIEDSPSQYIEELFPEIRREHMSKPQVMATNNHNKELCDRYSKTNMVRLQGKFEHEINKISRKKQPEISAEDMKKYFTDPLPESIIKDTYGERWVKCEHCGKVQRSSEFVSYGGSDRPNKNLGKCRECHEKGEEVRREAMRIP